MDHKLKPLIDTLALLVSVSALALTAYLGLGSMKLSRQALESAQTHNELSVRPLLDFQYKLGIGAATGDSGFLKLVNLGEGLAEITRVSATLNGQPFSTDVVSLSRASEGIGVIAHELRAGQGIKKNGELFLFQIPSRRLKPAEVCPWDRNRKDFFAALKITVEYESLYHHADTASFDYQSTNPSAC